MNSIQNFNPLLLVKPGEFIKNCNLDAGVTQESVFSRIESFKNLLCTDEKYASDNFDWWISKNKKDLPLVVKYLNWRGLGVIVPWEEIYQVIAMEIYISEKPAGTEGGKSRRRRRSRRTVDSAQPWHDYADGGFDILTTLQFSDATGSVLDPCKGLVLFSYQPGSKFLTRKSDKNDPLDQEKKKAEFNYRCACCGAEEGRFGGKNNGKVRLQMGHIDPRKMTSHSNIIPQCGSCNNHKGDEVYGVSPDDPMRYVVIEKISASRVAKK